MTFLKVILFSVAVLLVYTGFANILPQVQSDAPVEEVLDTGALDMAGLVAYGGRLFSGKGTCTLCHNDLGRAPDLLNLNLAEEFAARQADTGAGDTPAATEAYLRESMLDPSAYVVAGFGKKGSNDTVSPMPVVSAPPIEMTPVQTDALIAFLMDRAGIEPTVPLPSADQAPPPADTSDDEDEGEPLATTGAEAVEKFFCSGCHNLQGSEADLGPEIAGIGARLSRGDIMTAILDPNATIAEGYEADIMPIDFADQMQASELVLIVDYLTAPPK